MSALMGHSSGLVRVSNPLTEVPQSSARICVTCVGGRLIYDTIHALRSATDLGAWILGVDTDPDARGRLLCEAFEIIPSAATDGPVWFSQMYALLKRERVNVLIILSDTESKIIANHHDELNMIGVRSSVSSAKTVETITDKLILLTKLSAAGVDVGEFRGVNSREEMRQAAAVLGYPRRRVVIKPRFASGSRGVMILDANEGAFRALLPHRFCGIGNFGSIEAAMTAEGASFERLVAVPYYDGPVFDVDCIVRRGQVLDVCARLRQLRNPLSPTSTGHKIVLDQRVIDYSCLIAKILEIDGAGDLDVILVDGERPIVLDAGARFSGSVGGSVTAGANFPAQLVRVLLGRDTVPLRPIDGMALRPYITMAAIPAANEGLLL